MNHFPINPLHDPLGTDSMNLNPEDGLSLVALAGSVTIYTCK